MSVVRRSEIVAAYEEAGSLRDAAKRLGISMQRVHQVLRVEAPHLLNKPYDTRRVPRAAS